MGYTHYWYREIEIKKKTYNAIVEDFKKTLPILNAIGIKLAGGLGEGEPEITNENVCFNGLTNCGHKRRDLGITWASDEARGVSQKQELAGSWFAGALLEKRCCDGDCSHETFGFPRVMTTSNPCGIPITEERANERGLYFNFCKTAFKPYDLAVNVFLIIAKHHLKKKLEVSSDGKMNQWLDGLQICAKVLGYGYETFKLGE